VSAARRRAHRRALAVLQDLLWMIVGAAVLTIGGALWAAMTLIRRL